MRQPLLVISALAPVLAIMPARLRAQSPAHAAAPVPCPALAAAPLTVRDLEPATLRYQGTFTVGGRAMPVTSTLVVAPHPAGGWAVAERAVLPRGLAVDSARLDARSLAPLERTTAQGGMQVTLSFRGDSATGTVATAGQSHDFAVATCGSLVGDGAGSFLVLGRLPLAAGYRATLRHLDLRTATTTSREVDVAGRERVSVPAGDFDAWIVRVRDEGAASPTTIWIDSASLVPVKFSSAQGPVTIAMELLR